MGKKFAVMKTSMWMICQSSNSSQIHILVATIYINPSVWSDERCSSWRKHFLQWSDERCSSWCTLSLIRLYLDNIRNKCNRATSCLFRKELALLWCGKQLLEIIYSFFLCSRNLGFLLQSVISQTNLCFPITVK